MNTDIRIKTTFMYHHKTLKLEKKLGPEGVLALIRLWLYAAVNHPKGDISDLDNEDIAAVCLWSKDPSHLTDTLIKVGFIDETINDDGTVSRKLHDWEEHNRFVYYAPERAEIARQNVEKRWAKRSIKSNSYTNRNTSGIQMVSKIDTTCNTPIPTPTPTPIPTPIPVGDYKGVCLTGNNEVDNCTRFDKSKLVPSNSKSKLTFDERLFTFNGISDDLLSLWKSAYPDINIERELKAMAAWVGSQPKSRWKKDWKRFITNWLSREQEKAETRLVKAGNGRRLLDAY